MMISFRGALIMAAAALALGVASHSVASGENASTAPIQYVTGLQNPEDLLQIGSSKWLIASGLQSWTNEPGSRGHIYLVDRLDHSFEVLFPGAEPVFRQDQRLFGSCPGPIDTDNFSAHGLALKQSAPGRFRLYMTSHGAREAIEVFDLDARGEKPTIAWVGCVLLPARMWSNSVSILNDGGFLVTKSKDSTNPEAINDLVAQHITGEVYEWHPGGVVKAVPGTALSGPNGIALSADERWMFVNAMGTHLIVRFDRKAQPLAATAVDIPVYPDNVHWGDDGLLYVIGRNHVPQPKGENCPLLVCGKGWSILKIDPATLAVEGVAGVDQTARLQTPSAAIAVGDLLWVGNFNGDGIAYLPRPKVRAERGSR